MHINNAKSNTKTDLREPSDSKRHKSASDTKDGLVLFDYNEEHLSVGSTSRYLYLYLSLLYRLHISLSISSSRLPHALSWRSYLYQTFVTHMWVFIVKCYFRDKDLRGITYFQ